MSVLKYRSKDGIKTLGFNTSTVLGVTSVNGKMGDVTGLYDAENPPPYPVTNVMGRVGDIQSSYNTIDISESNENNQNVNFLPFDIIRAGATDSNLPAGNSMTRYLIFNESLTTYSARFIPISHMAGLSVAITDTAKSGDKFALVINFKNVSDESIELSHSFSIINFSNFTYTVNTFRRYL